MLVSSRSSRDEELRADEQDEKMDSIIQHDAFITAKVVVSQQYDLLFEKFCVCFFSFNIRPFSSETPFAKIDVCFDTLVIEYNPNTVVAIAEFAKSIKLPSKTDAEHKHLQSESKKSPNLDSGFKKIVQFDMKMNRFEIRLNKPELSRKLVSLAATSIQIEFDSSADSSSRCLAVCSFRAYI